MNKTLNIIKIVGVYVGIIIGAGFASGKEIVSFFTVHGEKWIFGIILTGILFSLLGWGILSIIYSNKVKSYGEFMGIILGNKTGIVMEIISGVFLCVLFFTMVAAAGAAGLEAFGLNYSVGVILMLFLCFIVFLFDYNGIIIINGILSPLMIISGVIIGLYTYSTQGTPVFSGDGIYSFNQYKWIFSAIIYVSYNIITAVTVLISVNELITGKVVCFFSGIFGGMCMCILGICIGAIMFINYEEIKLLEIPMLKIINKNGVAIKTVYIFMLISAIFTTAIGNGFGAIKWIESRLNAKKSIFIKIGMILAAGIFSVIGFSGFVENIYPLFGYLGLIQILFIAIYFFR